MISRAHIPAVSTKPTHVVRAAILARVSTNKQENARQLSELQQVAAQNGWTVTHTIETTTSGTATHRPDLDNLIHLAQTKQIDKIMVHEVSRLSRRNGMLHQTLDTLCELKVSLYWHAQRIETLLSNGKRNPAASMMFAILAEMARSEREELVSRIRSGLDEAKRKGKVLGRPTGTTTPTQELLAKHSDVVRHLTQGKSLRDTAARTGKGLATVKRLRRMMAGVTTAQAPALTSTKPTADPLDGFEI